MMINNHIVHSSISILGETGGTSPIGFELDTVLIAVTNLDDKFTEFYGDLLGNMFTTCYKGERTLCIMYYITVLFVQLSNDM